MMCGATRRDANFVAKVRRRSRSCQGAMGHYYRQTMLSDVRDVVPQIAVPTLVLNRSGNRIVRMEQTENVAARIPDAKLVELPGEDHLIFSQDIGSNGGSSSMMASAWLIRARRFLASTSLSICGSSVLNFALSQAE